MPLGIITLEDVLEGGLSYFLVKRATNDTLISELIGEEIYDEFDPQGARGDPYEVPEREIKPSEPVTPKIEVTTPTQKAPPSLPIIVPTALRNFGGLGFLRSRSAPPIPRDLPDENKQDAGNVEKHGPIPSNDAKIEMPKPAAVVERQLSSVVEPDGPSPEYTPSAPVEPTSVGAEGKSKSLPANTIPSPVASPILRTASPAPLEAVLLDRKRRLVGAAPSAVASTTSLSGSTAPSPPPVIGAVPARNAPSKGARFKSSPLGGVEATGVIVAEKVKDGVDALEDGKN